MSMIRLLVLRPSVLIIHNTYILLNKLEVTIIRVVWLPVFLLKAIKNTREYLCLEIP